jgi:2'-5' RNA ligase
MQLFAVFLSLNSLTIQALKCLWTKYARLYCQKGLKSVLLLISPKKYSEILFETKDIKRVVRDVESVAKNYDLVNFKLKRFGYFNNPNAKVIYADIEPSKELEELRWELATRLMKYAELKEWDKNKKFSFHATIAFKDIDRKFPQIWRYLKSKKEPNIHQHLLRITILRNDKILREYDLMLKRILNRRQALSKRIWKKTITASKIKLSREEKEEKVPLPEETRRRRLWAMIKKIFRWS